MRFGVREICNVVFKAKSNITIGTTEFKKGQPVLFIDSAKTSTIEGAATTVYATGGRGNTRLIAWEGEKTLTFTVEDALLSPIGFSVLSGAGLFKKADDKVHVHNTVAAFMEKDGLIDLTEALGGAEDTETKIDATAPVFVMEAEEDGSLTGKVLSGFTVDATGKKLQGTAGEQASVLVDFYVVKSAAVVDELQIDAANSLFRRQDNGVDMPAEITLPNVKIQSNFTFSMASTGDPSTFTFTMDAFPGYTMFDPTRKVLCVMQVVDVEGKADLGHSVMRHADDEEIAEAGKDDSANAAQAGE